MELKDPLPKYTILFAATTKGSLEVYNESKLC